MVQLVVCIVFTVRSSYSSYYNEKGNQKIRYDRLVSIQNPDLKILEIMQGNLSVAGSLFSPA